MLSIAEERRDRIIAYLVANGFARTSDLARSLSYSEATIRRDFAKLEKQGLLRRTHGGATYLSDDSIEVPYLIKAAGFTVDREKSIVAGMAQQYVHDDMTLFVDSSTTALHLASYLSRYQGLRIITNGVISASVFSEIAGARVFIVGGAISPRHQTVNGAKAYNDLLSYTADIAFVACRGFEFNRGANEINEGEALVKQAMRRQSTELILMLTQEKVGKRSVHRSLSLHDIDCLVTTARVGDYDKRLLDRSNVELVSAGGGDAS